MTKIVVLRCAILQISPEDPARASTRTFTAVSDNRNSAIKRLYHQHLIQSRMPEFYVSIFLVHLSRHLSLVRGLNSRVRSDPVGTPPATYRWRTEFHFHCYSYRRRRRWQFHFPFSPAIAESRHSRTNDERNHGKAASPQFRGAPRDRRIVLNNTRFLLFSLDRALMKSALRISAADESVIRYPLKHGLCPPPLVSETQFIIWTSRFIILDGGARQIQASRQSDVKKLGSVKRHSLHTHERASHFC